MLDLREEDAGQPINLTSQTLDNLADKE